MYFSITQCVNLMLCISGRIVIGLYGEVVPKTVGKVSFFCSTLYFLAGGFRSKIFGDAHVGSFNFCVIYPLELSN